MSKEELDTLSLKELKDFIWDKVKKQDETIEQLNDVMLWRTKEFKSMVIEWKIQHEKVKAMDKYLADYIITTDETHGKDMEWRDRKIESQAERIKELEAKLKTSETEKEKSIVDGPNVIWDKYLKMKDRVRELEEQIQSMLDNYGN